MQPIHSQTTTERKVRTAAFMILFLGAGAWFLYDGLIGYPNQNLAAAFTALQSEGIIDEVPDPLPDVINRGVTAAYVRALPAPIDIASVRTAVGDPGLTAEDGGKVCYFGPGGVLILTVDGARVIDHRWVAAAHDHDEGEQRNQVYLGSALVALGLVWVFVLVRVLRTRVALTDAGLTIGGAAPIPFDAMTGIRAERYAKTGRLDLDYTIDGRARSIRLDNYVIREFRPIITAICERKGFDNPLPPKPS